MHVPLDAKVLVLAMDDRIWVDSESLIMYLREVEETAMKHYADAREENDNYKAVAAYSSGDAIRQITDGLVLTTMHAGETIRSRRESRR